ncbi:ArsR family transcriptional regulator [Jatrophihabitans sp. GAS493]|uniref:ArsR/SmtB family transcription factor n=1 Tax=Jatrophihabitans sp. GAS493 TaxID=1907575 RepID=UPI000BB8289B|nr:metalloregulator ArsR/SmtB family transcription factor [Jatrophihabitans sp. GAS493]SOD75090.1 ArsR family transcriptional regulator [Jatrophihabitans sp. GAS493]
MVQYSEFDASFAALADPVRRGILERLGRGAATVSELAGDFEMSLTGVKKHIHLLEAAGMVVTEKRGRVRYCELGRNSLEREAIWLSEFRATIESRLDHLDAFLQRTENQP